MIQTSGILLVALSTLAASRLISYFARSVRRRLLISETAVTELPSLGKPRLKGQKLPGTAVICGGSIAGLVAARICHDHFERVVIIEPEAWLATTTGCDPNLPLQKNNRSRVVQYHSIQLFQVLGTMALNKLFPGFEDECRKFDIRVLPADFSRATSWGCTTPSPYEEYHGDLPKTAFPSRPGLETVIRQSVIGEKLYPNIEQIVGTVTGVKRSSSDPTRLDEVTVRTKEGEITLSAALVIDCTGPVHAGLKWLHRAGFGTIDGDESSAKQGLDKLKEVYDHKMHYTTLELPLTPDIIERLPAACEYDSAGIIYGCTPELQDGKSVVGAARVERDTIHLCCGTRGDVEPPRTVDGIKAFTKTLVVKKAIPDWFYEFLDLLAEVEDKMTYSAVSVGAATYIKYHEAQNLPSNWIAIGDSVMTVNPVYGQGCVKAIMGAITLNTLLRSIPAYVPWPADFSRNFFKTQVKKIEPIWMGTKMIDYGYDATVPVAGENLSQGWFMRWYIHRLRIVALHDKQAAAAWWHGIMFLAPGIDYFHPGICYGVA